MGQVRAVLLDLEGTLYTAHGPVPGAAGALDALRGRGLGLRFMTNIDSKPAAVILADLAGFGFEVRADELFTPVTAAQVYFAEIDGVRVHTLVSHLLRASFPLAVDEPPYTHVLVGDCRDTLDYPALDAAFRAVRSGAELVALQRGRYFKRADGDHLDTGGVVAALEYAAGVTARTLGKPSTDFVDLAARSLGVAVADCLVVGDDATTDVAGGRAAGAGTVQVRTGKYDDQVAAGLTGNADHVVDSIADLPELLQKLNA